MADWIDRVNRYFLNAIARQQPRAAPSSRPTLLPMSPTLVHQLARLDLASHDGFVGETWMLWGTLIDGTPTAITETDPGCKPCARRWIKAGDYLWRCICLNCSCWPIQTANRCA